MSRQEVVPVMDVDVVCVDAIDVQTMERSTIDWYVVRSVSRLVKRFSGMSMPARVCPWNRTRWR